ncbi:MAG: PstS family phosphate ABC transporter substrate-binding protein, partial [Acidobacteriota bacterium]
SLYAELDGSITIDGSSTVFPITESVSAAFERLAPGSAVRLGVSGTGGGFEKFCRGEIDVADASRPITGPESEACAGRGIGFVEVPIAFDGVSVVVNRANDFVSCLTLDELRRLWAAQPGAAAVALWSDLRPGWPDAPITLFAPGQDSGTSDYFTGAVLGAGRSARRDVVASEDDYVLAQRIAGDPSGLGFFGLAYFQEYRDRLHAVAIDSGAGCIAPREESIRDGSYSPLSRPLFLYFSIPALERREVLAFADLYLEVASQAVRSVGYVELPERAYELNRDRLRRRRAGSAFGPGTAAGSLPIERLLAHDLGTSGP